MNTTIADGESAANPAISESDAEAMLSTIIDQLKDVREQMKADAVEIARLKAESAVLRTETRAILDRLESAR